MSDGRVVADVSGVEWDNKRPTTASGASKKSGEFVRRGAITHAVAATELRKSQRLKRHAYVMRLTPAREKRQRGRGRDGEGRSKMDGSCGVVEDGRRYLYKVNYK